MANGALDTLIRTRSELERAREGHLDEITRLENIITTLDGFIETYHQRPELRWLASLHLSGSIAMSAPSPRPGSIRSVITDIVRERAGGTIHADEVLEELRRREVPLSEKDPKATVVTALLRLAKMREERGLSEGILRMGRNRFRWIKRGVNGTPQEAMALE